MRHSPVDKVISFMSIDLSPSLASPIAQVAIETCMHPTPRLLRMSPLLGAQGPSTRHLLQTLSEGPHHVEGTLCWLVNWPSFAMVWGADCAHQMDTYSGFARPSRPGSTITHNCQMYLRHNIPSGYS